MLKNFRKFLTHSDHLVWDSLILMLLSGFVLGLFLGDRPLANPDEGRYVEISREMLLNWDFITPTLNGVKYFEKPILFYWLQSACLEVFGFNPWAGRLISCGSGVLGVWSTYLFGRLLYSRITGLMSSLILLTTFLYFSFSHIITIDPFFSLLFSLSLLCVLAAFLKAPPVSTRFLYLGAFFCGLAVLTKGLVALLLPGLIVFLWVLIFNKWRHLIRLPLMGSAFIFLACVLPWHLLVSIKNPEFFDFYVIHEQFLRYFTPIHRRSQPLWFFLPVFLVGLFPWIIYLPQAFRAIWLRKSKSPFFFSKDIFLLLWIGATLVFFSLSHSKLIPYILPVMIPTALLLGAFVSFSKTTRSLPKSRFIPPTPLMIYSGLAFFLSLTLSAGPVISPVIALMIPKNLLFLIQICSALLWVPLVLYYIFLCVKALPPYLVAPLSVGFGIIPLLLFASFMAASIPYTTTADLTRYMRESLPHTTPIYLFHTYPQDLPFYLNRPHPLPLVGWKGELKFGALHTMSPWIMSEETFSSIFKKPGPTPSSPKETSPQEACVVIKNNAVKEFKERYPSFNHLLYGDPSSKDPYKNYCLICTGGISLSRTKKDL